MTSHPANEADVKPNSENQQSSGALLSDQQVRWLRRAVVVMTAILIAGIALLIGRVIYLAQRGQTQAASAATIGQQVLLPEVRMALPAGAVVKGVSVSGGRVAVAHAGPRGNDEITVVDLATGKVVSHVTIEVGK